MRISWSSLTLSLAAASCLSSQASDDDDELRHGAALAQSEAARCATAATPPAPDWSHDFANAPDQRREVSDYGTSGCASYVVRLINGGRPRWEQGYLRISLIGEVPTTAESCVGTSLSVRRWLPPTTGTTWVTETTTTHGEWTASGCQLPQAYSGTSFWTSGIRYQAQAQRVYCPKSGPYCLPQLGLPIQLEVERD